jgi:hypothetical protein
VQDRRLRHVAVRGRSGAGGALGAAGALDGARGAALQRLQPPHGRLGLRHSALGDCHARSVIQLFTKSYTYLYIHTYHSRFIPEGEAKVSQIFLRDTHVLPKFVSP